MNSIKRNVISRYSDLIVKDLHGDVIESLWDKKVLTSEEYNAINNVSLQEEKNEKFLEFLITKPEGFEPFLDSLREWYWWIEQKLRESLIKEKISTWEDEIISTNVPPKPLRNVSRVPLLEEVRAALRSLKKGHYVVLHGMSGCGKSSLAAEALQNEILIECFQGNVHWLSCGQDTKDDENEILALQIELNERICNEELVSDVKTANVKTLKVKLMKRFQASKFNEGLIVLDDVNSAEVVDALNIGCKTLVTTNDKDVMKNLGTRYQSIKVSESFTEEETMEHFALSVGLPVKDLPSQASLIHKHGKGHPFIMSLIGAQLEVHQEEAKNNSDSWQPYLDVLISKEYGNLKRRSFTDESFLPKTIELCVSNLTPEMREIYQDFALFVEDVNIKTEVLEILWDLPRYRVKQIMHEFYTKSLVVRKYNSSQHYYVYGIHDILRYNLRKNLDEEALKNLHLKLINRYKEVCKGDLSKLPRNDNYFFYYIGYHIANSQQFSLFAEWYFNLDFIEAKLKVAGPGDLLLDYKRYSSHFTDGCFDSAAVMKRLLDFVRFVEAAGVDVRRNNGPDIVQLALQEPHDSDVYKIALRLVQSRSHNTYLRFPLGPSENKSAPHTIQTKEKVSSACFASNDRDLIVAFESGTIQIINQKGYKLREYEGHSSQVTRLGVSSKKNIFLSVSASYVKVWKLPLLDYEFSKDFGDRSPSPSQRQYDFTDMFNYKAPDKRESWFTMEYKFPVEWASFSADGSKLAVCCSGESKFEVWQVYDQGWILSEKVRVSGGASCIFSENDKFVITGCSSSYIFIHEIQHGRKLSTYHTYPILALFALPGSDQELKFGTLTQSTLSVWDVENIDQTDQNQARPVPCLRDYNKGEYEHYTCCAATLDGTVVAVATSNNKILICDLSDGSVIREIHESSGNIKYLSMDGSKDHTLLACYDDATVRVWKLGEVYASRPATMKSDFVVAWTQGDIPVLVAPTYKSCVKKITNIKQSEELTVPVNGDINICGISRSGKYIAVGTSGEVFLHQEGSGRVMSQILHVRGSIVKLSVEEIGKKVYVVVGLKRSVKVWTCEEDMCNPNEIDKFVLVLQNQFVDCFILQSEELITISRNGCIKKWCMMTGELVNHLRQERLDVEISSADISCENVLVTLDAQRRYIHFYDLRMSFEEKSFKLEENSTDGKLSCCSFSIDGQTLVVGFTNGLIQIWNVKTATFKQFSTGVEPVVCVCVSRAGLVGAATLSRVLMITPTGSIGQARLRVTRLVMSPDDATIITVDFDGHLHLIDQFKCSASSETIMTKRSHIRVSFKHSLRTKRGQGAKKNHMYAEHLQFLLKEARKEDKISNLNQENVEDGSDLEDYSQAPSSARSIVVESLPNTKSSPSVQPEKNGHKRNTPKNAFNQKNLIKKQRELDVKKEILSELRKTKHSNDRSDYEVMMLSFVPYIRDMNTNELMDFHMDILMAIKSIKQRRRSNPRFTSEQPGPQNSELE